jgi:hypothetical protein
MGVLSKAGNILAGKLRGVPGRTRAGGRTEGPHDPVTLAALPVVLGVITVAASFVPTLRIARIDPAETLRAE